MSQAYTGVSISAAIATGFQGDPALATAYLTTKAGPGTTLADVVASRSFLLPYFLPLRSAPDYTIFTGLNLNPGTYYLIVTTPFDGSGARGWRGTSSNPGITLASGVTLNSSIDTTTGNGDAAFAPDSNFVTTANYFQFSVQGISANAVPEPGSIGLLASGIAAVWVVGRRRGMPCANGNQIV